MAKKDDIDLDNMDLDSFDFDIPEWKGDEEPDENSRKPVTRVVKGALQGAKEELATPAALRKAMTMALPAGYGLAADTVSNVASDARSLYDKITGDSPEIVRGSKRFGQKAMQMVGNKVLPAKLVKRINDSLEEDTDYQVKSDADYKREQEESEIAALAEIFKAKGAADEEQRKQDAAQNLEEKALDQERFKSNIQVLTAINKSMARLVGYQDKVTAKYQQKMLELNYRQFATQRQLVDIMTEATQKHTVILENIRKNTALPEAVKIRGSEMFSQLAHQRLMGAGLNTISNWTQNYASQVMNNVSGMVQGVLDPMRQMNAMGGEDIDKHEMAGNVIGSMIGSTVRDYASLHLSPYLAKNKYIARGGEKLRNTFSGIPQRINEYAQSKTEGTGFRAIATQMFKNFLPQFSLDSRPGGTSVTKLDEVATFDAIARRSLIEIIPGYLSEIAHWSRIAVTGESKEDRRVYNVIRGGFTSEKEQLQDVSRQILNRSERDSLRLAAEDFLKEIGGDTMSSKAQRVLKRKILDELANGNDLVPKRLADPASYPNEDVGVVDEITSLIIDTFNLDLDGNMADGSTEGKSRFNDIRDKFLGMTSMIPAAGDRIRILGDVLGKDSLRKLGFIERQGREDRINFDKIWSSILDEDDNAGKAGTPQSGPNAPDLAGKLGDRGGIVGKISAALADSANRADRMVSERGEGETRRSGLERFLGDKSTLITLIRESRDFHSETVDLLKELTKCGCGGGGGSSQLYGDIQNGWRGFKGSVSENSKKLSDWSRGQYKKGQKKFGEFKATAKDIWIQGEDHPILQEYKLRAGEYKDKATGEVLKRWEDIQGDVVDLKGRTIAKYNDIVDSGVIADYKGKVQGTFADKYAKFKTSGAGVWTSGMIAGGKARINSLGNTINEMRGTGKPGEFVDNLGRKAAEEKKKFRPRMKRLMRFFGGGKAGADVSSELTGDKDEDMLTLALRSVQLQYETLKQVTQERVRKGSYKDLQAKRDAAIEKVKEAAKGKGSEIQGLFAKNGALATLMAQLGNKGDGDDEEGGGIMDSIGDWFGGGDGPDGKRKGGRAGRTAARRAGRVGRLGKIANWGGRQLDKMGTAGRILKGGLKGGAWLTKNAAKAAWWTTKTAFRGVGGAARLAGGILTNPLTRLVAGMAGRAALGALIGAAGLVSAPVLAVIGIVGAGIAIGAYIYAQNKEKLPPLTRIRMAQYGIKPKADSEEFKQLIELEKLFAQYTSVDSEGKATVNSQSVPVEALTKILKIDTEIPAEENELFARAGQFLKGRFAAVYLKHVSNYYALTKSTDLTQIDAKVTGKAAFQFADKVAMYDQPEVFNAMVSPFEDEELDMDAGDVKDVIAEAKDEIKEYIKKEEDKDKTSGEKMAGAVASGVIGSQIRGQAAKRLEAANVDTGSKSAIPTASKTDVPPVQSIQKATGGPGALLKTGMTSAPAAAGAALLMMKPGAATELDDGKPVRYRVYGLTEMLAIKSGHLEMLENSLWDRVKYDKGNQAFFDDPSECHGIAESIFSPIGNEAENVYIWFYRRFMPTFLQYCSSVRRRANIDAKDAADRLKTEELVDVLRETANARGEAEISVWDITESPWPGYALNDDPESVKEPLYLLSTKIKDKTLQENTAPIAGQVRDKDGKIIEKDQTQINRPASADGQQGPSSGSQGSQSGESDSWFGSMWKGAKDALGFSGDSKPAQQGAVSPSGQSVQPSGAAAFTPGTPISHPGGGSGGNINSIPEPKGDGWDNVKDTLMAAANMVGVDPALAASIAGVESGFRPNAIPYKNPKNPSAGVLSSAASFYQVIKGTWAELMKKYAAKYGINPNTTQHDPRANALLGLEFIKENIDVIKKVKSNVTDTDVYMAHFLGPYGAKRFLAAPPGDPAINHVGADQAKSNPSIFYDRNGNPRTVAAVYNDFDAKLTKHRKADAAQVAQSINGGVVKADDGTAVASSGNATDTSGSSASVPSMVKPAGDTGTTSAPNTVAQAAPTDNANLAEKADARQVQNTTAPMEVAARVAETQTSTQSANAANTYGGMDKNMGRLIDVNEDQLEQLTILVNLVKSGGLPMPTPGQQAQELQASTQTTQNPSINTPKAAPKGVVSVARV